MRFLKYVWTFPLPLMALVNTGAAAKAGGEDIRYNGGYPILVYKRWLAGRRFAFAAWPAIFVANEEDAFRSELMAHEYRHLQQQEWLGGIGFLLAYGLCFLALWPIKGFRWYDAYRAIPFEVDAREYARRMTRR